MSRTWEALVTDGKSLKVTEERVDAEAGNVRWLWGNLALEVAPMGGHANNRSEERLRKFADELDIDFGTLRDYRWVASKWPLTMRIVSEPWSVHQMFAGREDREEVIANPVDVRTGERMERWTFRAAQRFLGNKPAPNYAAPPRTTEEKVDLALELLADPDVKELVADEADRPVRQSGPVKSFNERCAGWVHRANRLMMDGAKLAQEAEDGSVGDAQADLALAIYGRLTERQLDVEIRELFEAAEVGG